MKDVEVKVCGKNLPDWCFTANAEAGTVTFTRAGLWVARAIAMLNGNFDRRYQFSVHWTITAVTHPDPQTS